MFTFTLLILPCVELLDWTSVLDEVFFNVQFNLDCSQQIVGGVDLGPVSRFPVKEIPLVVWIVGLSFNLWWWNVLIRSLVFLNCCLSLIVWVNVLSHLWFDRIGVGFCNKIYIIYLILSRSTTSHTHTHNVDAYVTCSGLLKCLVC